MRIIPESTDRYFYCEVIGDPAPQGSKSFKGMRGGHAIMAEDCKKLRPWRESVVWAAREAKAGMIEGPVTVNVCFYFRRPKSAPKRVTRPFRKPDIDKCLRAVFDSLVAAGVIEDDARVVGVKASKFFCGPGDDAMDVPGAAIEVEAI